MKSAPAYHSALLTFALSAMALAVVGGLGLAMWIDNGAALFLSFAEAGLAWCF